MLKSSVGPAGRRASRAPAPKRVRVLITMEPEVLETFKRMAAAASISVGRCVGDWCGDTVDGAQFVAAKMIEAKSTPRLALRELEAMEAGGGFAWKDALRLVKHQQRTDSGAADVGRGRAGRKPPVL